MARRRAVDRVLNTHGKGPRIASGIVIVLGLIALVWLISPTERKRRDVVDATPVGSDSAAVVRLLGPPVRCPLLTAEQLRPAFPADWPPPAVETAVTRIGESTAQRWIYAINARRRIPCDTDDAHTEVGIGEDGRVLWLIAVTGRTPIELPEDYSPSNGL